MAATTTPADPTCPASAPPSTSSTPGQELERIVARLRRKGFEIRGDQLKTSPRGYSTDHPRIDLLRYKSMSMTKSYGFEDLDTPAVLDRVREDWRALRPLVEWVKARVDVLG